MNKFLQKPESRIYVYDYLLHERFKRISNKVPPKHQTVYFTWNYENTGSPAVIFRYMGVKHNDSGPAVLFDNGGFEYFVYGTLYRNPLDGPVIYYPDCRKLLFTESQ